MRRLLDKPLKAFTAFALIVLACSIPAYFYLVEAIWMDELDDHNLEIKRQIQQGFSGLQPGEIAPSLNLWNRIHPESRIIAARHHQKDSVYTSEKQVVDEGVMELERFRGLISSLELNGRTYVMRIETNVEEAHETIIALSAIACIFMAILILGFVALNRRISKRIWRPFSDTLEKLRKFDLNSTETIDLGTTEIREFSELNATLEKLIRNNVRAFRQQKEFAQNASHELQTPLAILKSKIDLLIQSPSLTPEERQIIESLDNSVARITRINKNLLLLAGIENKDYESTEVEMSEMVQSLAEVLKSYSEDKGKSVVLNCETGVKVLANESLAEILVNNLLSNAIRHGSDNSQVEVMVDAKSITVANGGKEALHRDALFKRFIAADANSQGTGLGLAIVKEICEKYGWKESYTYSGGRHIFSVSF